MELYIHKNGQELGPFTESRVRFGIESGEFATNDLGWRDGVSDWIPLSRLIPPTRVVAALPSSPQPQDLSKSSTTGIIGSKAAKTLLPSWLLVGLLVTYPTVFFVGLIYGINRTTQMGGVVSFEDDLTTRLVFVPAPSVVMNVVGIASPDPDRILVEHKDRNTGKIVSSESLNADVNSRGLRTFNIHFPDSSNAVIRRQ